MVRLSLFHHISKTTTQHVIVSALSFDWCSILKRCHEDGHAVCLRRKCIIQVHSQFTSAWRLIHDLWNLCGIVRIGALHFSRFFGDFAGRHSNRTQYIPRSKWTAAFGVAVDEVQEAWILSNIYQYLRYLEKFSKMLKFTMSPGDIDGVSSSVLSQSKMLSVDIKM